MERGAIVEGALRLLFLGLERGSHRVDLESSAWVVKTTTPATAGLHFAFERRDELLLVPGLLPVPR